MERFLAPCGSGLFCPDGVITLPAVLPPVSLPCACCWPRLLPVHFTSKWKLGPALQHSKFIGIVGMFHRAREPRLRQGKKDIYIYTPVVSGYSFQSGRADMFRRRPPTFMQSLFQVRKKKQLRNWNRKIKYEMEQTNWRQCISQPDNHRQNKRRSGAGMLRCQRTWRRA